MDAAERTDHAFAFTITGLCARCHKPEHPFHDPLTPPDPAERKMRDKKIGEEEHFDPMDMLSVDELARLNVNVLSIERKRGYR